MLADVYRRKRVLVTGHTGFKGSWLTAWLLELGAEVAGFSLGVPTDPSNFVILGLEDRIRHFDGDIRNRPALAAAFDEFTPEIVFHLAAQSLVRRSFENPTYTFETNMIGTMNVLECLRRQDSVRAGAIITSDKCYRNVEWLWGYRENDALGGDDPYSASKAGAELVSASFMKSYFHGDAPRIATTRAGNVIGGGDWAPDRIVPDAMRAWLTGQTLEIRSPEATRPWQHVLEPLSGYLWLVAKLWDGAEDLRNEAFNFGPLAEVNHSVHDLLKEMSKFWPGVKWQAIQEPGSKNRESTLLKLNCDKALQTLGWHAVLSFEQTVRLTSEWYRRYFADGAAGMLDLVRAQIKTYVSDAERKNLPWAR